MFSRVKCTQDSKTSGFKRMKADFGILQNDYIINFSGCHHFLLDKTKKRDIIIKNY